MVLDTILYNKNKWLCDLTKIDKEILVSLNRFAINRPQLVCGRRFVWGAIENDEVDDNGITIDEICKARSLRFTTKGKRRQV